MTRVPRLAICSPAYDGRAHNVYWRGISQIQRAFSEQGVETAHFETGHSANLPRLRNKLVALSMDWGADAILWVDTDIAASPRDALALWHSGKDIIGAAPQKRPQTLNEAPQVAFKALPDETVRLDHGVVEVGGVATAFCLTGAKVFEKMRETDTAKKLVNRDGDDSDWFRNFFWYELVETPEGYLDDGEDYYFCRKARELGFQCYIEPSVRPIHHGNNVQLPVSFWDVYGPQLMQGIQNGTDN